MRPTIPERQDESGAVLIMTLFLLFVLAGLSTATYHKTMGTHRATVRNALEQNILYIAESGLDYAAAQLGVDPFYAVRDIQGFRVVDDEYVARQPQELTIAGDKRREFVIRVKYFLQNTPVVYTSRPNPQDGTWNRIRVTSTTTIGGVERSVSAWYSYGMDTGYGGAIVSEAIPTGGFSNTDDKWQAKTGDVVFSAENGTDRQYVYGGVQANGAIRKYVDLGAGFTNNLVTTDTAASLFRGWSGDAEGFLAGTEAEVPAFTQAGSSQQLFDFDRFVAAAENGGGQVYNDIDSFVADMQAANAASTPLQGITVLRIDSGSASGPKIDDGDLPGGININGTLVFMFSDGTAPDYKVVITAALNINPADLSTFNPADEANFPTGYPPVLTANEPWLAPIDTLDPPYVKFTQDDDFPALMFNTGIVDIHGPANISGVVYGPSFIEVENKVDGNTQFFAGAIIGGAGVFVDNNQTGTQALNYNPGVIDQLATEGGQGKTLQRTGLTLQ